MGEPQVQLPGPDTAMAIAWGLTAANPAIRALLSDAARQSGDDQLTGIVEGAEGRRREIHVSRDFWEFLKYESARRGISTLEVYEEEEAAAKAIDALGISEEFLSQAARRSNPASKYLEGEQDCPF